MARDTTPTARSKGNTEKRRTLKQVAQDQGRSLVWLARQTGYSASQIYKVVSGDNPGSVAFHLSMERTLGEAYQWPRGLRRPENGRAA